MRRTALPIVLALFPALLHAEQKWLRATSANFELYTTAGEKKAREGILYFEKVHSFFQNALHATAAGKGRVRIVAFQSAKEYEPYGMPDRAGFAGGTEDRDDISMRSIGDESYPIAVHEYVHILLKAHKATPLWLNEGLAQLYQTLHLSGKKVLVGQLLEGALYQLHQNRWIDLATLFAVDHDSPYYTTDHSKVTIFYAESWALTHMLALSDRYRPKFQEFFRQVVAGTPPQDALRRTYDRSLSEALGDLRVYLNGSQFPEKEFDVALEKSAEDPEIRPVPPLESGLVLASLLVDTKRSEQARQAYTKLESEYPTSPEVPEAFAYLAWREGKRDEASAHFSRAVELGSKNARVYYNYAAMGNLPLERKTEMLRRAVDLDPDFYDARLHLALQLNSQQDYAGALAAFNRLKTVHPEHAYMCLYAIAFASYKTGDKEAARANAKRAFEYAKDPDQKEAIEGLLAVIDNNSAALAPVAEPESAESAESRPRARRALEPQPSPKPVVQPALPAVEGAFEQVDCLGATARIRIGTAAGPVLLLIDKPNAVSVRSHGAGAGHFDLTCGPQKERRTIRVEYAPQADAKLGTIGLVRVMEMK
jgi:tetratricopeptide (TPR) repeat protein